MQELATPDSGYQPRSIPFDINNDGLIVGSVIAGNGYQHAAAWRYGQLTDLGASTMRNDAFSTAPGVNNRGQIVGSGTVPGGSPGYTPLSWVSYDVGPFNVHGSYGSSAINDPGQVLSTDTAGDLADHRFVPILIQNGQVPRLLEGDAEGWFTKINNAGQAIGTVNYNGAWVWSASGGYFNDAASWDSGLGLSPNKFLDSSIATASGILEVIGVTSDLEVKSLSVGGGGGTSRLILIDGGRINAREGTRLLPGGRLTVAAGSDAIYATGHLGGNLRMGAGSGIELKAGRPTGGLFDRLVIDGDFQIDGGEFVLSMLGARAAAGRYLRLPRLGQPERQLRRVGAA